MRRIIVFLFHGLLLYTPAALCQPNDDRLVFRHFNVEHGLSQGSINAIFQDHKGFVWIGTHDGLNRFDGTEFKVFKHRPDDPRSLASSWIFSIVEDAARTLWVRTAKGAQRFNRATETFGGIDQLPPSSIVSTGDSDSATFWVAANPLGVFNALRGEVRDVPVRRADGSLLDLPIYRIARDEQGNLWGAGTSGIFKIDPRKRIVVDSYDVEAGTYLTIVPSRFRRGDVWLGSADELLCLKNGTLTSIGKFRVPSLLEDSRGYLWIGTHDGLARLDLRDTTNRIVAWARHNPAVPTSLSHNVVTHLLEDAAGSIWVGTYNGLNLHDIHAAQFTTYRGTRDNPKSLGDNFVIPIAEDTGGNIWFGTFGAGLSVLGKGGTFRHFRHVPSDPNSIRGDNIRSLLSARDGRIWIGTSGGLSVYDPARGRLSTILSSTRQSPRHLWIEALCQTTDGSVWALNGSTLLRFHERNPHRGVMETITLPTNAELVSLHADKNGNLWIASLGEGLIRFDRRTRETHRYRHNPSDPKTLSNDYVWTVLPEEGASLGTVWVGTSNGLNRLDARTGTCIRYLEQEGFPNAWVYGILRDDMRRLWLSTHRGLVVFDDSRSEGSKFRSYTHADGLAGNEFNRRSYCKLSTGELLFGGPNGVTRFHPGNVIDNPAVPPLVLTGFSKVGERVTFDRDVADVSSIELNHDQNVFTFEYAALHYGNPSRIHYAYMMEGIDKNWTSAGGRRTVNYAYLPSGEYVFRVKASHTGGTWNNNEIAVNITIRPPFWATWWFMALAVLAGGGGVAMVVRTRVRRLLEIERLRSRIARDLHDEIGSNLSSIAMASDLLRRQRGLGEMEQGKLSEISSVALNTVKDMKDIVWLIKPGNDSIDDLFLRMKDTAAMLLEGCRYSLSFPNEPIARKVDLEWRQHVYLIFKEALTNIAKHARAGSVSIAVAVEGDTLAILIEDDGKGFNPASATNGSGLRNMQERADILKAHFMVAATPAGGTKITLTTRIT